MQTWTFENKDTWLDGPWKAEPDKAQWTDEATGLVCLIRRGPNGALCGYVGVGPDHPWHGKGYSECLTACDEDYCWDHSPDSIARVHGGLTFADSCDERDPEHGICHIPEPGQEEHLWWFGFDCAHCMDLCPKYVRASGPFAPIVDPVLGTETYRDIDYVRAECAALARQLAERRQ